MNQYFQHRAEITYKVVLGGNADIQELLNVQVTAHVGLREGIVFMAEVRVVLNWEDAGSA
jgi:hypothetical protein